MVKVSKKKIIEAANLQPLSYFQKYHDILCHNLRMSMKKIRKERIRGPAYAMTVQILEQFELKQIIIDCWFLELIINMKKELLKNE